MKLLEKILENMELPLKDGNDDELANEIAKEKESAEKEDNKVLKKAEKAIDEVNSPSKVDVPKEIPFKILKEKLQLTEGASDYEMDDFTSDLYQAVESVVEKYANYWGITPDEVAKALDQVSSIIQKEPTVNGEPRMESFAEDEPGELHESLKVISSFDSYQPWSGAIDTWDLITDAHKVEDLDSLLEEAYPEGLTETELNDLLWFEPEWVLSELGIDDPYAEEDEEEVPVDEE